jgi:hypothetical protein
MAPNEIVKCAHHSCRCQVEIEEQFCSAACASEETQKTPCICGHLECTDPEQAVEIEENETAPLSEVP